MKSKKLLSIIAVLILASSLLVGCIEESESDNVSDNISSEFTPATIESPATTPAPETTPPSETAEETTDVVVIAVDDGRFTTLVAALEAAELVDTLKEAGPYTVFVPTDAAFNELPAGTVEGLLEDIPALTDILLYHVIPGKFMAADLVDMTSLETVSGGTLNVSVEGETVMINDAQVITPDIEASNGVIHVIDTVLIPSEEEMTSPPEEATSEPVETTAPSETAAGTTDIVVIAVEDGRFTTLVAALEAAELVDTLKEEGPYTVFAPTDDAFSKLPAGTAEGLLEDIPALTDILLYHVVPGKFMAADLADMTSLETVSGGTLDVSVEGETVMINDAQVITPDIEASNGVIHVIDTVLIPSEEEMTSPSETTAPSETAEETTDIVVIAVEDGRFTTLVAALEAAELVDTLKEAGPYTVFAPTDAAFNMLPADTVEGLLEDIPALTDILLYHVVSGKFMAADLVDLTSLETLSGGTLTISSVNDIVMINNAEVIVSDIEASNGVIHVIDMVLMPVMP